MAEALIGHSGFVGQNLAAQHGFDDFYNSRNIESIQGRRFELLVCAGMPAEKWRANRDPESDRATLDGLTAALERVHVGRVILISTVDVYPEPVAVDEATPIEKDRCHPYGRHRLELEHWMSARFDTFTVRLPGLFGRGLKKNVIYDLLHQNRLDQIHPDASYQFYGLDNLWRDIERAQSTSRPLVNFATAPVSIGELARVAFGVDLDTRPPGPPARYDVRTRFARDLGGSDRYLWGRNRVLAELSAFVEHARARAE